MKTKAIIKGIAIAAIAIIIASCSTAPLSGPNPLDEPGETEATVSDLHRGNVREITNNPCL